MNCCGADRRKCTMESKYLGLQENGLHRYQCPGCGIIFDSTLAPEEPVVENIRDLYINKDGQVAEHGVEAKHAVGLTPVEEGDSVEIYEEPTDDVPDDALERKDTSEDEYELE
jgi:hypothetical protein